MMVNEAEKKTLGLFGYVFLVILGWQIFCIFFGPRVTKYLDRSSFPVIPGLLFLLVAAVFAISYFVLAYQSAKILKKHGKSKIAPIFWLLLLFVPIVNLITAVILWIKNNNLLRESSKLKE